MESRHLRLIVSNSGKRDDRPPPNVKFLHAVPDSDLEIRRMVKRFSAFLLEMDDSDPVGYLHGRRRFDTSKIVGAIDCLSPKAADSLQADLMVIAQLSIHPALRHAAIRKLAESELS